MTKRKGIGMSEGMLQVNQMMKGKSGFIHLRNNGYYDVTWAKYTVNGKESVIFENGSFEQLVDRVGELIESGEIT